MGPAWKSLQRWIYPMAVLTLLHWLLTNKDWTMIIVYTGPLILLMIWRVWRYRRRMRGI
jgi:sulfoxide reductase heme-binding subunit YedZ